MKKRIPRKLKKKFKKSPFGLDWKTLNNEKLRELTNHLNNIKNKLELI